MRIFTRIGLLALCLPTASAAVTTSQYECELLADVIVKSSGEVRRVPKGTVFSHSVGDAFVGSDLEGQTVTLDQLSISRDISLPILTGYRSQDGELLTLYDRFGQNFRDTTGLEAADLQVLEYHCISVDGLY